MLAVLAGLYVLVFGVVGAVQTVGAPMFDRSDDVALGLRTNLAFALLSVGAGVVILLAIVVGRNVDRAVNLWGGVGFMAVGTALMAVLHTGSQRAELLDRHGDRRHSCIGLVLFTAGMYGLSGAGDASQLRPRGNAPHGANRTVRRAENRDA